jgi:HAMP domain-containing protein
MKSLSVVIKDLQLAQKLLILLSIIFVTAATISGGWIFFAVNHTAQQEISSKAGMLMTTMDAVRNYTSSNIKPRLQEKLEAEFLAETVPAFSANTVFKMMQERPEYKNFSYREAALNPTNLADKADAFETSIINSFRKNTALKESVGFYKSATQGDVFYVAHPLAVNQASCLQCHSQPANAPKNMVEKYGSKNGFNWNLHEIIGAQMVLIPAAQIIHDSQQLFFSIMGIITMIFAAIIMAVNYWIKRQVVRPVTEISNIVSSISMGELNHRIDIDRTDEIGQLAHSINRLTTSLNMAMQRLTVPKK